MIYYHMCSENLKGTQGIKWFWTCITELKKLVNNSYVKNFKFNYAA